MREQRPKEPKKRGRPAVERGYPVQVRLRPEQLAALDQWIEAQVWQPRSRPEAIRRLLDRALGVSRRQDQPAPSRSGVEQAR